MKLIVSAVLSFSVIIVSASSLFAQKGIWDHPLIKKLTSSEKDSTRSPTLLILPVLGYAQETGLEFGLTGIYNFYVSKSDTTIFTSNLNTVLSYTTENQINVKLESDIWTEGNEYHYIAAIRYKKYPFNYYGIGDQTSAEDKVLLTQKFFQLNLEAEKKIVENYYGGVNVLFESFSYRDESTDPAFDFNQVYGGKGGKYMAL